MRTDRGQEFRSKVVNAYLKSQNIQHFYALNTETKANYAERLIKTLKHKLFRYMLKKQNSTLHRCPTRYSTQLQSNCTRKSGNPPPPVSITEAKEVES